MPANVFKISGLCGFAKKLFILKGFRIYLMLWFKIRQKIFRNQEVDVDFMEKSISVILWP